MEIINPNMPQGGSAGVNCADLGGNDDGDPYCRSNVTCPCRGKIIGSGGEDDVDYCDDFCVDTCLKN